MAQSRGATGEPEPVRAGGAPRLAGAGAGGVGSTEPVRSGGGGFAGAGAGTALGDAGDRLYGTK